MSRYKQLKPKLWYKFGPKSHNYWPKLLGHSQIPSIAIKHQKSIRICNFRQIVWVYVGIVGEKPNFGSNWGLKRPKCGSKFLNITISN